MAATDDYAHSLLFQAFRTTSVKKINKMLAGDLTLDDLAARLQPAVLSGGIFVAVDRETIRGILETACGRDVPDDELDEFINHHYDDECGPAQDELHDCIVGWADETEFDDADDESEV